MKKQLNDRKHWLTYAFWSTVNKIILKNRFRTIEVDGWNHLPERGVPFILVSNHTARWDGLLIYQLLDRPSNFIVSPNELAGFQGRVLQSMGAFPASSQFDLMSHVKRQLSKGEPLVIFPEGDIHRDGSTHPFKSGAARFALACSEISADLPICPVALAYGEDGRSVKIKIAPPLITSDYSVGLCSTTGGARALTERCRREVAHLRYDLGCRKDMELLFGREVNNRLTPATA